MKQLGVQYQYSKWIAVYLSGGGGGGVSVTDVMHFPSVALSEGYSDVATLHNL